MDIREAEPRACREAVVDLFWEHRHWPGTTHTDYLQLWDRRYVSLSDGEPWVWTARDDGEVVGHIACFPRRFRIGNVVLRAAVSGDLLVRRDRRHTLLGIQLLSIPHRLVHDGALDLVYSFPNHVSYRLALGAGWHDLGAVCDHVDLRRATPVLHRRIGSEWGARALGTVAGAVWRVRRRLHQRPIREAARRLHIDATDVVDPAQLDRRHWQYRPDRIVGADSTEYIVRRFLHDPLTQRRLFAVRSPEDGRLEAYVIVEFRAGRAVVCDGQVNAAALDEATAIALVARHLPSDVEVFSVPTLPKTQLAHDLRALGFVTRAPRDPHADGIRLTALWSRQHPLAATLARAEAWNLYSVGATDA